MEFLRPTAVAYAFVLNVLVHSSANPFRGYPQAPGVMNIFLDRFLAPDDGAPRSTGSLLPMLDLQNRYNQNSPMGLEEHTFGTAFQEVPSPMASQNDQIRTRLRHMRYEFPMDGSL
jgi:hypothetical protein